MGTSLGFYRQKVDSYGYQLGIDNTQKGDIIIAEQADS